MFDNCSMSAINKLAGNNDPITNNAQLWHFKTAMCHSIESMIGFTDERFNQIKLSTYKRYLAQLLGWSNREYLNLHFVVNSKLNKLLYTMAILWCLYKCIDNITLPVRILLKSTQNPIVVHTNKHFHLSALFWIIQAQSKSFNSVLHKT